MTLDEMKAHIAQVIEERMKALKAENAASDTSLIKEFLANAAKANEAKTEEKVEKGVRVGRMIRALARAKGDCRRAAEFAQTDYHDEITAKALGTSPGDAGGWLVPVEYSNELIELLRPASVVRKMGANVVPMETGSLKIPRLSGGATASYTTESTAINASQESTEQLNLNWKKLTAIVPVSNELLRYSSPSADMMVRDDLVLSMATAEDVAFIRADGTSAQPRGLRYWCPTANVNNSTGTSLADVDVDIKTCIEALTSANVRMLRPGWLMSPRSKEMFGFLRTSLGPLAYPSMDTDNPTLKGYKVGVTNNIPNNLDVTAANQSEVYLVDFADVIIGEATQFILEVSNEASYVNSNGSLVSAFSRDETVIKAIARHDFAMRHDASVAILDAVEWS